jgi:hypothetical protein
MLKLTVQHPTILKLLISKKVSMLQQKVVQELQYDI